MLSRFKGFISSPLVEKAVQFDHQLRDLSYIIIWRHQSVRSLTFADA